MKKLKDFKASEILLMEPNKIIISEGHEELFTSVKNKLQRIKTELNDRYNFGPGCLNLFLDNSFERMKSNGTFSEEELNIEIDLDYASNIVS